MVCDGAGAGWTVTSSCFMFFGGCGQVVASKRGEVGCQLKRGMETRCSKRGAQLALALTSGVAVWWLGVLQG